MAARRLLIIMVILLGISTVLAVSIPESPQRDESETTTEETSAAATTTEAASAEPAFDRCEVVRCITVDAGAKRAQPVRLVVGDQVALRVKSAEDDVVEVRELGLVDAVSPEQPATFDLLVSPGLLETQGGRYAIRLVEADRLIGQIEITGAPDAKQGRTGDSPTQPAREESAKASPAKGP